MSYLTAIGRDNKEMIELIVERVHKWEDGTTVPEWLRERMRRLAERPPPTIEQMRAQWRASEEYQRRPSYANLPNHYS